MEKPAVCAMVAVTLLAVGAAVKESAMAATGQGVKIRSIMSVRVRIENDLGGGIMLHTHCKSRDDDIGNHDLANSRYIQWSFNNSWLGDTLYWCSMKWNNVQGSFDVYGFSRDFGRCADCWWSIRRDGAYSYRLTPDNTTLAWQLLYVWRKK